MLLLVLRLCSDAVQFNYIIYISDFSVYTRKNITQLAPNKLQKYLYLYGPNMRNGKADNDDCVFKMIK